MIKVIIIGAGASGMMAAIQAAENGALVTVLDHNDRPGRKILATGNGRCNLTNIQQDSSCYRSGCPGFPWEVVSRFNHMDTLKFFSRLGIYTKNRNGWMYPYNDQAASVAEALEMEARHLKVKIKTNEEVTAVNITENGYEVVTGTWKYEGDRVIIACGSPASNVEGSSSTGYKLAKSLGHTVTEPYPALVGLKAAGNYFGKWAGCRMDGEVSLEIQGDIFKKERGEIMFTEYGVSGIPVFQISRYAVRAVNEGCRTILHIDLMPGFSLEELKDFIIRRMNDCPYKSLSQSMTGLLPKKMIPVLVPEKASVEEAAENMKDWKIIVKDAYSIKQAQVCSGGVTPAELTNRMESILHPGLFFAGEVVDVDGPCGGYNLQWAWSSGAVAGTQAALPLQEKEHT